MNEELSYGQHRPTLAVGEAVLWRGKPKRSAFVADQSMSMLPIAVIWLILDLQFLIPSIADGEMLLFIIPFFALHLMPVWIWLGSALTAGRRWKNTNYYVTNRRIIIQGGFLAVNETSLFYKDLRNVRVHIGLINKLFHTGNVEFDDGTEQFTNKRSRQILMLQHLEEPNAVYDRIQRIILDIQTDMEYPNALRPSENPGYQTDYRP